MTSNSRRQPKKSLRTILIIWFLLVSIVPLFFVTGYSVINFENAIDHELSQRLTGNAREIEIIFSEYKAALLERRDRYVQQPAVSYPLSAGDASNLQTIGHNWIRSDIATSLSFFSRSGKMLLSLFRDKKGDVREFLPQGQGVFLAADNLKQLQSQSEKTFIDHSGRNKLSLIVQSQVKNNTQKLVGFVEQLIEIDVGFLKSLKQRMGIELFIVRKSGAVSVSTHPDFQIYGKDFFLQRLKPDANSFFELMVEGQPFGFLLYPLKWGGSEVYLALGASKSEAKAVMRNVNYAFFSVIGTLIILLVFVIVLISNAVIKPLDDLVQATQTLQTSDMPIEIPIKSDTEVGLLTESFNEMSRAMLRAREELKKKITELESANKEIRETQSRLIHTSKMSSLGQLVAGVAHELNNPIGFIYSNLSQLKDYFEKLEAVIETAEAKPNTLKNKMSEIDYEYLKKDLPKLLASCEDGARRTRDIVIGLRNFSRLDEAKLKEVDINESLDATLHLLAGELKNRITVHRVFSQIPPYNCYASQLNQVFMNILTNAAHAIKGEGDIWVRTRIEKQGSNENLVISIQDSGTGISTDILEKIFDPFFSTKGVGEGTGLGLSISYGIIQRHKGDVQVKSEVGVGTEFIITLPMVFSS